MRPTVCIVTCTASNCRICILPLRSISIRCGKHNTNTHEQVDHKDDSSFATPMIQRKIIVFVEACYRHARVPNAGIDDNRTYDPVTSDLGLQTHRSIASITRFRHVFISCQGAVGGCCSYRAMNYARSTYNPLRHVRSQVAFTSNSI